MHKEIIWDSEESGIIFDIGVELDKAERKFPDWPIDPVHAAAIVTEESGELTQAALDFYYRRETSREKMRTEALHTAVTVIRFLKGLNDSLSHLRGPNDSLLQEKCDLRSSGQSNEPVKGVCSCPYCESSNIGEYSTAHCNADLDSKACELECYNCNGRWKIHCRVASIEKTLAPKEKS